MTTTVEQLPDTSVPENHIDIDSQETQKLLDDAFNQALGKEVTPTKEIIPDKAPDPSVVTEDKKDAIVPSSEDKKEDKVAASTDTQDSNKDTSTKIEGVPDWAKDLPKEIQEKILGTLNETAYHQQRWRSDVGRQSALQNKLMEARRELANIRSQLSQVRPQEDPALAAATNGDHSKSLEEWKQIIEADPTLAKAIDLRIKSEVNQAKTEIKGQIDANIDPLYQHNQQSFVEEQYRLLREAVPNVDEVLQSPVYRYWMQNKAAPGIRTLAETSVDANDAVNVLRVYAQDAPQIYNEMVQRGMITPPPQQTNTAQQVAVTTDTTATADKVAKTREQKVHMAPVVPTAPITAPTTSIANTIANSKPGQAIDLDDSYVQKLLEDAYNQYKRK